MPTTDAKQTFFDESGALVSSRLATWKIENHLLEGYSCPFCLAEGPLERFVYRLKSGKWSRKCKCFDCGVNFYLSSLVSPMSLSQYAKWIATYPAPTFWSRCAFDVWVKRLGRYGDTKPFWDEYHAQRKEQFGIPR